MRSAEHGQAVMETMLLGLLLLVPLIWLLTVLGAMQTAALATTAAAREAGLEVARSLDGADARRAVDRAVTIALQDQSLDPRQARVETAWTPGLQRGTAVQIQISYPVAVLRAPFLGAVSSPVVWVEAIHVARIDPFRSRS